MPQIELDEAQYAELARVPEYRSVFEMITGIMKNPKARKKLLEARKEADPNASIPELDAAAPINAEISAVREELAATRKELSDDKTARETAKKLANLESQWERGRAELRTQGYTDEGITAIEALMEKEGIASHAAASAYYDRLNPPAEPISPSSGRLGIFDAPAKDDVMRMLHDGNDEGFLKETVSQTLGEIRAPGRRR